ncbi:MAG: hypothetical protein ACYTG1_05660 [Planctomycetota bacterium]|jgi:hypothetical protein
MAGRSGRTGWIIGTYVGLAAVCALLVVVGLGREAAWAPAVVAAGLAGLLMAAAAAPIALMLASAPPPERRFASEFEAQALEVLRDLAEHSMVSDSAKRVLFRERELDMLRRAIEADIAQGNYDAGLELCDQMSGLFGYRQEAEEFRSRILHSRNEHYEAQIHGALDELDELLGHRDWAHAHQIAARIRRLYPDSHLVRDLDRRIHEARRAAKSQLEAQLLEAAGKDDVERAMALLKELDRYLTRDEAARLAEVASGVVVKHRDNLGVQFRMAVNDHRWAEAARIGETIVLEFPNTKMADEVRSMIDVLRMRATQAAVAAGEQE